MPEKDLHTDQLLFVSIADGDGHAFAQLFRQYYEPLRANAYKLMKSAFWAEEVVQEVFLYVWAERKTLVEIDQPAAYLYRVTANRCLNRLRRQELESRMQYFVSQALHDSHHDDLSGYRKLEKLITEATGRLPAQQQRIFRLQQEEGLSYQEIASRLGISKNTVRNHMVQTLKSIRQYLQQYGDFYLLLFSVWFLF
ncbi:RNA polymerase sigma-70 factor [Chitinophaga arvensicola]|uniref:RNA polymerase sigma factor n=1 Tax=Chitinophaga arvensicola TaxID=29529 RepID=A0A1I0S752_9BACT|nr:RNA polymerase sigma-70 factor [Chitinophaga arvensicola]SEW51574.1 RNA polymerase sigma-70 factor, ECF subfamily [Chitinophaga arvensicola]